MSKFKTLWDKTQKSSIAVDRLMKPSIIDKGFTYNKKTQEIILVDEEYITGTSWKTEFKFTELDDKYLDFMNIYSFLETTDAYTDNNNWQYWSNHWWESYNDENNNNIKILKIRAYGYVIVNGSSNTAPVYITCKIKVLNTRLYDLLTNTRI